MSKGGQASMFTVCIAHFLFVSAFGYAHIAQAEAMDSQIDALRDEVTEREARIQQINDKVAEFDALIAQKERETRSLQNTVALLENRIAKTELDLEATELQIENTDEEIRLLDLEIAAVTASLEHKKAVLTDVIRAMANNGDVSPMEIVFGSSSFAQMMDELERLERINKDLEESLQETQEARVALDEKRSAKDEKRLALKTLEEELQVEADQLNDEQGAKEVLIFETQESEEAYRALVQELNEEQEYIEQEIVNIQDAIDKKILDSDLLGDSSLLTYPLESYRITTLFHDPSYPFRYLFEHSGLDLAAPYGTPIKSAAPGYVAVARTGRMYGNYVMVIHGNGIATLYAHLSSINVTVDEFVGRGEVIGLVGSTGFSTGPHVHFEVRVDGIPVDPLGYLVD